MILKNIDSELDCLVIGAGPAGCAAAAIVAEAGFETLLVEREQVPRFHVGESLMPETFWTLDRLGVIEKLNHSLFSRKIGVQFVDATGRQSQPFYFRQHDPRDSSETWHVERAEFDKLLFDNAAEKGAHCADQTRVTSLQFCGAGPHRIRLQSSSGDSHDLQARVVIDATGQQSLIANQLKLREMNREMRKAAIWGHFQTGPRESSAGEVTMILHTQSKRAWFWHIPISNDRVSVGLVSDNEYLLKDRGSPDEVFREELANCPYLDARLGKAPACGPMRISKEFSYTTSRHSGDGWVLVGDAFGFIDPIYSSGVFLALKSGEMAADCVVEGLTTGDTSAAQLGKWTPEFIRGTSLFRKLVNAFYTNEFSIAGFLKEHPEHHSNLTDLLIGRAFYEGAGKIFEDLEPALEAAKLMNAR